jgi:hypothetical protein
MYQQMNGKESTSRLYSLGDAQRTITRLQRKKLYRLRQKMICPFKKVIDLFLNNGYKIK